MTSPLVIHKNQLHVILRQADDWGIQILDLGSQPSRLANPNRKNRSPVRANIDPLDVEPCPTPASILNRGPAPGDNWSAITRRSLARLEASFLVAEDPQRRLDAREVVTLAHQVSLVRHILDSPDRRRVLIGDEVGLGKTIVAGLILQELLQDNSSLRVLYLAPARLVSNVAREFRRLKLGFREWKTQDGDARLDTDTKIIASIHRAVHPNHFDRLLQLPRWDVIVVDECHHLSDWAQGGGDPVRKYRLVRDLVAAQARDAYLLLLSGTPHQAHQARFENLLRLLQKPDEQLQNVRGRVIYRTKEDVRDWDGNPLFPQRQVNQPILIDLSPAHQAWLTNIHNYFRPSTYASDDARYRAAGWKCAQALQWATSSPNAGLGYLVRQALRAGQDLTNITLRAAISELRPYRSGQPDEPIETLYERLLREIRRQIDDDDLEDIEGFADAPGEGIADLELEQLISEGIHLVRSSDQQKWQRLWDQVILPAGPEKIVLFAQPIETVMALAEWIRRKTSIAPAVIIGGQSEAERERQVELFRNPEGAQFLISSRAGGEGINLQFARRLVHLDVPWNPMEREQRAGRVHRFGSRKTVLVDTLIVRESRESHAWTVARERLNRVAQTVVSPERFETVFSRVMCLIPPEELQTVLIQGGNPELQPAEIEQISQLVDSGFQSWQQFHDQFAANQRTIRDQSPGLARWQHLRDFLIRHGDAEPVPGIVRNRFEFKDDQVMPKEEFADVLRLSDESLRFVGDFEGNLFAPNQVGKIEALGLNITPVARLLSECSSPRQPTGAAFLKWSENATSLRNSLGEEVILLGFTRQRFLRDSNGGIRETGIDQIIHAITRDGTRLLGDEEREQVFSLSKKTIVRVKPVSSPLTQTAEATERELIEQLRRPSEPEIRAGVRYAVWPILAAHISP